MPKIPDVVGIVRGPPWELSDYSLSVGPAGLVVSGWICLA